MTTAARPGPADRVLKAWIAYAIAGLALTALGAGVGSILVSAEAVGAIWFSALLAYGLQLLAFAGLVLVRSRAHLFLAGWMLGMALRFGVVVVVAWWLSRSAALPREVALLSLVSFVFLLLLLEPVFLRWGLRES
jgi:hypothetical protein